MFIVAILLIKKDENDINDFVSFFDWIEITNATESSEVDFSDGVVGSAVLQGSNLGPGVVGWIVLEHLQTSKTSHHQSKNFTQYLISFVIPIIMSSGDNHLLVQLSSSKTEYRPGKIHSAQNNFYIMVHLQSSISLQMVVSQILS